MKRSIVYLIVIVCLLIGTAVAQRPQRPSAATGPMMGSASGPGVAHGEGDGPTFDALKSVLGLSDAQVTQLRDLQRQRFESTRAVFEEIRTKQQALHQALESGSTDAAALGRLLLEIQALQQQVRTIGETYRTQALAILDAAQKTKLAALEEAIKLQPAIHQAAALNLLVGPPGPPPGPGGPGPRR